MLIYDNNYHHSNNVQIYGYEGELRKKERRQQYNKEAKLKKTLPIYDNDFICDIYYS